MICDIPNLIAQLQAAYAHAKTNEIEEGPFEVTWKAWDDGSITINRKWPNGYVFCVAQIWPEGNDEDV